MGGHWPVDAVVILRRYKIRVVSVTKRATAGGPQMPGITGFIYPSGILILLCLSEANEREDSAERIKKREKKTRP